MRRPVAAKYASQGLNGHMVIFDRVSDDPYQCLMKEYDVHKIANVEKKVPRSWINETGDGVTEDFLNYARPLIQGEIQPYMENGLPVHLTLPER